MTNTTGLKPKIDGTLEKFIKKLNTVDFGPWLAN